MDSYLWRPRSWFSSLEVSRLNLWPSQYCHSMSWAWGLCRGHVGLLLANMLQNAHVSHPKKSLTVNAHGRPGSNRERWRAIPAGCWGQRASWVSPHTTRWYGRGWVHGQHNRPPNSAGSQASCGKQGIKETQTFFPQIHNKKSLIWSSDLMPTGNKAQLCSWKTMALQRGSSGAAMASGPCSRTFWGKRWACTICGHLPHVAASVQTTFKHSSSKAAIIWWAGWEGS